MLLSHGFAVHIGYRAMAHYARIVNGKVERVIVVSNERESILGESGVAGWLEEKVASGIWIKTSYNNNIRKQYAGIGFTYSREADVFIAPQPYPSWSLDENHDWQPPIPMPADGELYSWDEENTQWVVLQN